MQKLGDRFSLVLGSLCYVTFLGAFILPLKRAEYPDNETLQNMYWFIYISLLIGATLCGFGASILWVA